MRKTLSLLISLLLFAGIILLCWLNATSVPTLQSGDTVTREALHRTNRVYFAPEDDSRHALTTILYVPSELQNESIHLLIADIRSFRLLVNGEELYRFEGTPATKRLHDISLQNSIQTEEPVVLSIAGLDESLTRSVRCLLGDGARIQRYMDRANALTLLLAGIYLAIMVNCLSLYLRKKSEDYLLYMMLFTFTVAVTGLLYSNYPIPAFPLRDILHMGYLHAASEMLSLILVAKLMRISAFDRLGKAYPIWLLVAAIVLVFILNQISYTLRVVFLELIFLCKLVLVVYAALKKRPFADVLMIGAAVAGALNIYNAFVNYGFAKPTLLMYYFHMPALYSMILAFFCLFAVNDIFAKKFKEAEELVVEVEAANQKLDEKVRRRTAALEETNARLLREQNEKHAMMTNLFHDLRSPLFCAIGYTDMIEANCTESKEEIAILRRQLNYLSHLTEELFLIAKLEDKQITFASQPVDMCKLCSIVLEEMQPEADQGMKNISFEGEQAVVTGDGFRLRQALENIIGNAIKHTPNGTEISVHVFQKETWALVSVRDNGQGIAPEIIGHLFDRYYSQNPGKTSSGLGLPIAKEIVQAHGGHITVESEPGEGSCFTIWLPLQNEAEKKEEW